MSGLLRLRLAMAALAVLPAVAPFGALALAVQGGRPLPAPSASGWLALLVGVVYAWFWLGPSRYAPRVPLAVAATACTATVMVLPGAPGGAFLLWAYPAVLAGFSVPARPALLAVAAIGGGAILTTMARHRHDPSAALFTGFEAVAVLGLAGAAAVAVHQLQRTTLALSRAEAEVERLAVAEERSRFARDLHDLLGHSLSLLLVRLQVLRGTLDDPDHAAAELAEVEHLARVAMQETREVVTGYRQPTLAGELAGAAVALDAAGIALKVGDGTGPMPAAVEATLAWVLREAITNVLRHSGARTCAVHLGSDRAAAWLEVRDDGHGAATPAPETGLRTLRDRVRSAGGRLAVGAGPDGGLVLSARVPLHGQAADP